jgi:hypothetical protein
LATFKYFFFRYGDFKKILKNPFVGFVNLFFFVAGWQKIHHKKNPNYKVLFNVFFLNHLPNIIINYVNEMLLDFKPQPQSNLQNGQNDRLVG